MPRGGLLALSPHLDDAVFACGDLIASQPGTFVATVFTAGPPPGDGRLRPWDADCGFHDGEPVMRVRRAEDRAALSLLDALPMWLPFRDAQYRAHGEVTDVATVLDAVIRCLRPSMLAMPLGMFHSDHVLAAEAALAVRDRHPRITWLAYEDALYRRLPGDPVATRVTALRRAGVEITRAELGGWPASSLKQRAVACYRSQLRGLVSVGRAGYGDTFAPEAYWLLR